jgi:hypothetical protein
MIPMRGCQAHPIASSEHGNLHIRVGKLGSSSATQIEICESTLGALT